MEKVLIALDYNPKSEVVLQRGYNLAREIGAAVCLLHVLTDVQYYGMQYDPIMGFEGHNFPIDYDLKDEYDNIAKDFLDKAKKHLKEEDISTHLARGNAAEGILEYAAEWKADTIVMGTHSHSTLEKIFLGSVASKILGDTNIPVYMVPTGQT